MDSGLDLCWSKLDLKDRVKLYAQMGSDFWIIPRGRKVSIEYVHYANGMLLD
jgi:hypothetical protein